MPYKRAYKRKPVKKRAPKRGLNKKERSEVVKIAKKAITTVAEKKFMDSTQYTDISFGQGRLGECPVATFGYSTTDDITSSGS